MGKWWSVLFGVMMAACALLFVAAPFMGIWLPPSVSTHSGDIDRLFYVILGITGFFFILTEAILVVFMYRYAAGNQPAPGSESVFAKLLRPVTNILHDQHRVEMAWTIVPAVILLYIAFVQVNTWADIKYQSRMPKVTADDKQLIEVEISARQFEWKIRYPSPTRWESWKKSPEAARDFAKNPHQDDLYVVNELHVFTNSSPNDPGNFKEFPAVLVHLRTTDVLHSFNIPVMRVKQDSLPGKTIPVWFRPTKSNTTKVSSDRWDDGDGRKDDGEPNNVDKVWEIACAELCGWGHYRMIGRVYVHPDETDWLAWLKSAAKKQQSHER